MTTHAFGFFLEERRPDATYLKKSFPYTLNTSSLACFQSHHLQLTGYCLVTVCYSPPDSPSGHFKHLLRKTSNALTSNCVRTKPLITIMRYWTGLVYSEIPLFRLHSFYYRHLVRAHLAAQCLRTIGHECIDEDIRLTLITYNIITIGNNIYLENETTHPTYFDPWFPDSQRTTSPDQLQLN